MTIAYEYYTTGDDTFTDDDLDIRGDYCYSLVQTFTIGTTGPNVNFKLKEVHLKLQYIDVFSELVAGKLLITELIGGKPSLASIVGTSTNQTEAVETPTTKAEWFIFNFSEEELISGRTYALIYITSGDEMDIGGGIPQLRIDKTTPTYTGGSIFGLADDYFDTHPTTLSTIPPQEWVALTGKDLMFIVAGEGYEGTLCSYGEVKTKAGSGASATSTDEAIINTFVQQAQSEICAITRFNWVENYADLNEDLKYILNDLCSNIAAIYCINYDMNGYDGGSLEAQRMIDNYRERNKQLYKLLENQEVKTFICEE